MRIAKWWFVALPMLVGAVTAARRPSPDLPCAIAAKWVKNHASALPANLAALSRYSLEYRKAIYRAIPISARAHLWHEQFAYYERSGLLDAKQRAFVDRVDGNIELYLAPSDSAAARDAEQMAAALFPEPLRTEVFATIGFSTVATAQSAPSPAEESSGCTCSTNSPYCGTQTCVSWGGTLCSPSPVGCGFLLLHSCDGVCQDV
jgi:hypothetical protein